MKIRNLLFILVLFSLTLSSCIGKDLDFSQTENIELTPIAKVSLMHFTVHQSDFIDPVTNLDTPIRLDITDINAFSNEISTNNIDKILIKFEIENTFNKEFDININFLDVNNIYVQTIPIHVDENTTFNYEELFLFGATIFNATQIFIEVEKVTSTNTVTDAMFLNFKSAADIHLKINND